MSTNRNMRTENKQFTSRIERIQYLTSILPPQESEDEDFEDAENCQANANDTCSTSSSSPAPSLTQSLENLLKEIEEEEKENKRITSVNVEHSDTDIQDLSIKDSTVHWAGNEESQSAAEVHFLDLNIEQNILGTEDSILNCDENKEIRTAAEGEVDDQQINQLTDEQSRTTNITSKQGKKLRKRKISVSCKRLKKNERPFKKCKRLSFNLKEKVFKSEVNIPEENFTIPANLKTPYEYFRLFFSDDLFNLIVTNTNMYSVQTSGSSVNIILDDIKAFLGIELLMGICSMPAYSDYWNETYGYDKIRNIMSLKQYKKIRSNLHFSNILAMDNDKYFKIRPLLDIIRKNFMKIENEKRQSIDEMMVPYKGTKAGNRRQYIKSKPKKWGFKIFVRAGVSGFVYDFIIYGGADTFRQYTFPAEEETMGLGAKVVLGLCQTIPDPVLTAVYFDNFFCSLDLVNHLRSEYGILALGTLRSNRMRGTKLPQEVKKRERGTFVQRCDNSNNLVLVKWKDNKDVLLVSNYVGAEPVGTIKRFSKTEGKKVNIICPKIVSDYNQHMGGVDLCDMLVSLYRTSLRTKKWYQPIFSQLLDVCISNSWILMRREHKLLTGETHKMPLKAFRLSVAESLLRAGQQVTKRLSNKDELPGPTMSQRIRSPSIARPQNDIRYDGVGHFAKFASKGRCKFCKGGQTSVTCVKCEVRLCFIPDRNCFYGFHNK